MSTPFRIDPGLAPATTVDPAVFVRTAFEGRPLATLIEQRLASLSGKPEDAAALLELGVLFQLVGQKERGLDCQRLAIGSERIYRQSAAASTLRVLMLVTAGDLMANTPLELMVEGRGVEIAKVYLDAGQPWPAAVPDHDVALMAVGESDESAALLGQLIAIEGRWPRPMINRASGVLELSRERLYRRLAGAPGVAIPPTARMPRGRLNRGAGEETLGGLFDPGRAAIIVRPVGSHAGKGLERIEDWPALEAYVAETPAEEFYVSPFVDYAGQGGLFRKYRIAQFGGRPYLCHMAVSEHWMVHYLNAGMAENPAKREEERLAMEGFDEGFARRHAAAFQSLQERLGLDYFAIDCAETSEGELLIFEADVAMIVHDLDPEALYPYKKRQMRKVFDAFEAFLRSGRSQLAAAS
jgi:hypothetical protein